MITFDFSFVIIRDFEVDQKFVALKFVIYVF